MHQLIRVTFAILILFSAPASALAAPDGTEPVSIDPKKGYYVGGLGNGLYWVTDGFYTSMFATTGRGVIVVDAPPSLGAKLLQAISSVTREPVTHVIYSHSHADHIGAAGLLPSGIQVIAHRQTQERLARAADPARAFPYGVFVGGGPVPPPTFIVDDKYTLAVGDQVLELRYDGDDHEPGNLFIYAPRQKVLMKVDIVFPGWSPFEYLAIAENTVGYMAAIDKILGYDFSRLVSGHWNRLAVRKDVMKQKRYLRDIERNAATALQTTDFGAIAARVGTSDFGKLFQAYLGAVVDKCVELTVPQWKDKLGGVESLTGTHCHQLVMALRVD